MAEPVKFQPKNGDGKSWAQWKRELSDAIEELDKSCGSNRDGDLLKQWGVPSGTSRRGQER